MKPENITLYPAKTRVVPNIKLIKNLAKQSTENYQDLLNGAAGSVIEKKNHKKFGKVTTLYEISNAEGYDGTDPLNEFDYAVLSACISEWKELNRHSTFAIILRSLTGKTHKNDDGIIEKNQREWILNGVNKLMSTLITVDLTDVNEKFGYSGEKKLTAPILPAKYVTTIVNGQPVNDVIFFTDESPILKIAEARNQIIRYDTTLLDIPNLHNTPRVIMLKSYILRRVHEIMLHNMTPTLTFSDIFNKCDVADNVSRKVKFDVREIIEAVFNHLKAKGVVETFEFVKKGNALYSVTFIYKLDS